jgi:hypothetical protein
MSKMFYKKMRKIPCHFFPYFLIEFWDVSLHGEFKKN